MGMLDTLRAGSVKCAALRMPILEIASRPQSPLFPLDDTPREIVLGAAGQPWNEAGVRLQPGEFRAWERPENVKIAAGFLIEDAENGHCRLVAEMRVTATDE